jgi:hypothetical protein
MKTAIAQKHICFILILTIMLITGCAHNETIEPCLLGQRYGFPGGLWHGFIAPFDFIGMLFNKEIAMYAPNNNGGLYALGFLIGSGGWGFLGGKGAKRVGRSRIHFQSQKFDKAEIVE